MGGYQVFGVGLPSPVVARRRDQTKTVGVQYTYLNPLAGATGFHSSSTPLDPMVALRNE